MHTKLQNYYFLALLLLVGGFVVAIVTPYLQAVALGAAFAAVFHPLYVRFLKLAKGYEHIAASLTTVVALIIFLVPILGLGTKLLGEARGLYTYLSTLDASATALIADLQSIVQRYLPGYSIEISTYAQQITTFVRSAIRPIFSETLSAVINLGLGFMAFYYLLKDGDKLVKAVVRLSPLPDQQDKRILDRLHIGVLSVLRGSVIIAVIQGTVTAVGLAVFGVPNATLWGSMAAVTALIPAVGTTVIIAPAALYLALSGSLPAAGGLLLWGVVAVGLIDNLLGPKLIGDGVQLHPFLVLLSAIGGITFFGPIGFLLGPLIFSLLFTLLDLYQEIIAEQTI